MLTRIVGVLVSVAAALAVVWAGPAQAAGGSLTLFLGTNRQVTFGYPSCPHTVNTQLDRVVGFANRPPSGCLATLVNPVGQAYPLCAGQGRVPPAFQNSPQVRIVRGTSVPCAPATG